MRHLIKLIQVFGETCFKLDYTQKYGINRAKSKSRINLTIRQIKNSIKSELI